MSESARVKEIQERAKRWAASVDEREMSGWVKGDVLDAQFYVEELVDALTASLARERELRDATTDLLGSLHAYYFTEGDEELEQVNRMRRLLGMREQMPKCCEAEAQADEAEGKMVASHDEYHAKTHGEFSGRPDGGTGEG